jgi:hypothetical protein
MSKRHWLTLALALCLPAAASAQDGPHAVPIDAATRTAVISSLADQLRTYYVFPDVAQQVGAQLIAKNAKGGYAAAADTDSFSEALSTDLRALGKDGHFRVGFAPGYHPHQQTLSKQALPPEEQEQMRQEVASMGYGVQRVERLNGNVGYMELRAFGPTDMVGDALSSAMALLSGTDAIILDLRRNGGGEPSTVAYLMSHFFAAGDKRHLNDLYFRPTSKTEQYWTTPSVSTHYTKPLYVLTSARTFSGGEEFAYDVQTQKRGVLVGETTGGGANPGDDFSIGHDFVAFIPTGRAINPVTHTNWEHVGVKPDIATPAADAQKTAYATILRKLLADAKDPGQREELQDTLHKVETGVVDAPNYAAHP